MQLRRFFALAVIFAFIAPQVTAAQNPMIEPDLKMGREVHEGFAGNYLAGRMAIGIKDLDASAKFLKKALSFSKDNSELRLRAFAAFVGSGQVTEGLELAPSLLKQKNADKLVHLVAAVDALKRRQFAKAVQLLNVPKRGEIKDVTGGLLAAWAYYGAGNAKEALDALNRLQGPGWVITFRDYHKGLLAALAKNDTEAAQSFAKAYAGENSKILSIARGQAVYLASRGRRDEALKVVRTFLKEAPNNSLMAKLASDIEAGRAIAPLVSSAEEGAAEAMFMLGAALARNNGDELAAIYLQLSLYLNNKNPLALISLADLYEQFKQPQKVMETLRRVPDDSTLKPAAELQLAVVLNAEGKTDEALSHLDRLLAAEPENLEALVMKGNVLRVHKRYVEALPYYERAIQLVPSPEQKHWTLFYFRGITYERTKQWPKAEADLKKALQLQPDHPLVLNYLGYSWIDRNTNLEEGMRMLKRAVQQNPNEGDIIDSVGWAYFRMGQYDEAVSWLLRAVTKKPSDPTINDHLGDAYWKVGRKLEAFFQWRQAKDLKPEPEDLARIEAKLKQGYIDASGEPPPAIGLNTLPAQTDKN